MPRIIAALLLLVPLVAADNAAQARYGARIEIACKTSLNTRWAKPEDLLGAKPAGPIINDMASARVALSFPVRLRIARLGIAQMGKKDGWTRASSLEVSADGKVVATVALDVEATALQVVDIPVTETDNLVLRVAAVGPADAKVAYGGFAQLQALVDEDLAARFAPPAAAARPALTMATPNLGARPAVTVIGKPRKATGWPRTIWDGEDIAELKRQIAEVPAAKEAFARCVAFCEDAVAKPVPVPDKPDEDLDPAVAAGHNRVVDAIANLGIGYALSGDERFAAAAAKLLLRYADLYESWPVHGSPKFKHDASRWSWQRLGDAIWLIQAAWGFDLIHASPSLSEADRAKIRDHFIKPCVREILRSPAIIAAPTNWSVICCAAVMIGSRVAEDEENYRKAVDGLPARGGKKKGDAAAPAHNGGIWFHLDKGIDDDGMWAEGAIGYQFMAMRGLVVMAEILWRDGVDVWGYGNGRLKLVFDSPIWYCYPGGRSSAAIHDSGSASLFGRDAHLYQYALRRYGDPVYKGILARITPSLASVYNLFVPACDFRPVDAADLPAVPSILFPGVGFTIARTGEGDDSRQLVVDSGPNRSHGHPDKLGFSLFALGEELFADGGSAWYSTDVYQHYYNHTLAHNTVLAAGQRQTAADGHLDAFCQSGELALIRTGCDAAIPATALDRTLVLMGDRLYDLYRVDSRTAQPFDLPCHSAGELTPGAGLAEALRPWASPEAKAEGYSYFEGARAAAWDQDWTCAWKVAGGTMRMHAIGAPGTELVLAATPKGGARLGTVLVRRQAAATTFASACDLIANGREPSVRQVRALPGAGGDAIEATLADGVTETVIAAQTAGEHAFGAWSTDAGVVAVRRRGAAVEALILDGGTFVRGEGVEIRLSAPGLVTAYLAKEGLWRVANHGEAAVEVTWNGLAATGAATLDAAGAWGERTAVAGGRFTVPARGAVDLASGGSETVAQVEAARRVAKQRAAWEAEKARQAARAAEIARRLAEAKREPVPAGYLVLIEAESPSAQGGGTATVTATKAAAHGTSLSGWNERGHWLEYACEVEHTGWYQFGIKYCIEGEGGERTVLIDGKPLSPDLAVLALPGTGGWSNGADQWRLLPAGLDGAALPFRLERGRHVIRLENTAGGGCNLDYLVLAPAQAVLGREMVEGK